MTGSLVRSSTPDCYPGPRTAVAAVSARERACKCRKSRPAQPQRDRQAPSARVCETCRLVWSPHYTTSFLFRPDLVSTVPPGANPEAPRYGRRERSGFF